MKEKTLVKIKKTVALFLILVVLFIHSSYGLVVYAEDVITQTPTPEITQTQTPTETPISPTPVIETPTPIPSPTTPIAPTAPVAPEVPQITDTQTQNSTPITPEPDHERPAPHRHEKKEDDSITLAAEISSIGIVSDGNVGNTTISTGDATNSARIVNDANTNISSNPNGNPGAVISNIGNGDGSNNSGAVSESNASSTLQNNNANVSNSLNLDTNTGDNSASRNVGNSTIETGQANTSGTIINTLNTNVDGIQTFQFDVVDDHLGDLVLDFSQTQNCVSGCGVPTNVSNGNNGSESINDTTFDGNSDLETFQYNDANVENNMILTSNSGGNSASRNTHGNSTITTDDANVSANILNFANNNIAGDVVYVVVNIYGNLIGDILMPDPGTSTCCNGSSNVSNSGNDDGSSNTANASNTDDETIYQFNNADIENNLTYSANTGQNEANGNTNGDTTIDTGKASILAQTVNIANMNLVGGNYWLVLVNQAGQWFGKIVGQGDDTTIAGSDNLAFAIDPTGSVSVSNNDNGENSENNASSNQTNNSTIPQTNDTKIVNSVNLLADSGHNKTSKNTGGDNSITTGDATIVANIVNFVNNNIVGNGKLFVTVVNVFGSWLGDFVGPGQTQEHHAPEVVTGESSNTGSNSSNQGGSSNTTNSANQTTPTPTQSLANVLKKKIARTFVLGTTDEGEGETTIEETGSGDPHVFTEIAGDQTGNTIHINLAWSLVAIPFLGAFVVIKKRRSRGFANVKESN